MFLIFIVPEISLVFRLRKTILYLMKLGIRIMVSEMLSLTDTLFFHFARYFQKYEYETN